MSSCNNEECNWFWVNKFSDLYCPSIDDTDVGQEHGDGYVDISLWVCANCGQTKAEVE
jgi:hypothetical protein